jgi:long-chain acyl-CoA synthetase
MTLVALLRAALAGPSRPVLLERDAHGAWAALASTGLLARVEAVAHALRERGVGPGDRVALMSPNRVDWIVANLGILFTGAVTVPIYATQARDQIAFILADAAPRLAFADSAETAARLREAGAADVVAFDDGLAALLARGDALRGAQPAPLPEPAPDDLAVLIYTSGTTGIPKGVMLTHRNIATNVVDAFSLVEGILFPGDPVLSVLPFAHIYEHANVFGFLHRGATIYVNTRVEALLDDLRDVRPTAMFGVPRIFERTYAAILTRAREAGGMRARLVPWAFELGRLHAQARALGERPPPGFLLRFALARALVLRKVRAQLGCDRLRFFGSGSASLHPDIAYTFAAADITIVEGYGLTECSPVVTANDVRGPRIGTVGRPIPGVEVRLDEDGELLVRGPNVMRGYYHQEAATAAVLHDGWLRTGDVATIDAEGFVRIVDRKHEIFKTSGGKYISPARVEAALLRSPYVGQVVVLGSDRAHPAALISPNWAALRGALALPDDVPDTALSERADVRALLADECARTTADLAPFEQIRWLGVLPRDLSIDAGELTPTLKVKRRVVDERYAALVPEYRN